MLLKTVQMKVKMQTKEGILRDKPRELWTFLSKMVSNSLKARMVTCSKSDKSTIPTIQMDKPSSKCITKFSLQGEQFILTITNKKTTISFSKICSASSSSLWEEPSTNITDLHRCLDNIPTSTKEASKAEVSKEE